MRFLRIAAACAATMLAATLYTSAAAPVHFRFAILGDRTGEAQPGVYQEVWREIDAFHPDFVIGVGDTIQGGDDRTAGAEWAALAPLFHKYRQYPLYFTPGNHDIWSEQSRRIYERATGRPAHYSFDYANAHFTVLDNSGGMALSAGEMHFLESDLERNRDKPLKFVFCHEPFWLLPVLLKTQFPFQDLAEKYHITAVVSGHVHRFARFVDHGVVYLLAGSSGGHLRGSGFAQGWFFLHIEAHVDGTRVDFVVKECNPPYGQGRSFRASQWSLEGIRSSTSDAAKP
jgi:predicted phosphodiesterase